MAEMQMLVQQILSKLADRDEVHLDMGYALYQINVKEFFL
jgi:hypothetical protein